jgi:hypothetical protein
VKKKGLFFSVCQAQGFDNLAPYSNQRLRLTTHTCQESIYPVLCHMELSTEQAVLSDCTLPIVLMQPEKYFIRSRERMNATLKVNFHDSGNSTGTHVFQPFAE